MSRDVQRSELELTLDMLRLKLISSDSSIPDGVETLRIPATLNPTVNEDACRDGIVYTLPQTVERDSTEPFSVNIRYPAGEPNVWFCADGSVFWPDFSDVFFGVLLAEGVL